MITAFLTYRMFFFLNPSQATPPSLTETLKSQRLSSLNSVDTSCMVIQIVSLNIVKDGGMFCGGL